jgi:hypothetical protein
MTCMHWKVRIDGEGTTDKQLLCGCWGDHSHRIVNNAQTRLQKHACRLPVTVGRVWNITTVDDMLILCVGGNPVEIRLPKKQGNGASLHKTTNNYTRHGRDTQGRFEPDSSRLCCLTAHMLYFSRYEGGDDHVTRGKIVRVNLDTFEEKVLDTLEDSVADFLVDDNQTITYLTSGGELRQENPDNSTIQKTCVNLKPSSPSAFCFHSLCKISAEQFVCSSYINEPHSNRLLLCTNKTIKSTLSINIPSPVHYRCNTIIYNIVSFGIAQMLLMHKHNVSFVVCRLYQRYIQLVSVFNDSLTHLQTIDVTKYTIILL